MGRDVGEVEIKQTSATRLPAVAIAFIVSDKSPATEMEKQDEEIFVSDCWSRCLGHGRSRLCR
jgi:hypothetical protein